MKTIDNIHFVPYNSLLQNFPQSWVFFVGLSHKLWKSWEILEAFSNTTNSGKLINKIILQCPQIPIYQTNLVKGAPLDQNRKIRYPNLEEKEKWTAILQQEIHNFSPKIVVLFGKQVSDMVIKRLQSTKISPTKY